MSLTLDDVTYFVVAYRVIEDVDKGARPNSDLLKIIATSRASLGLRCLLFEFGDLFHCTLETRLRLLELQTDIYRDIAVALV